MKGMWFLGIFGVIGLGLLWLALHLTFDTRTFLATAQKTEGTVIEMIEERDQKGSHYAPKVTFKDPISGTDRSFVSKVRTNPPAYEVGEKVTVLYDPVHAENARLDGFFSLWGGALISGIIGVVFALIGAGGVIHSILTTRLQEWLKLNGQTVTAKVNEIYFNAKTSKERYRNGRTFQTRSGGDPYWKINAQWQNPTDQKIYVFHSEEIYFDPTEYVKDTVIVRIDPRNPKRYQMDISFLPKAA